MRKKAGNGRLLLSLHLYVFAEIVFQGTVLITAAGWEKPADDPTDVMADVEFLRVINAFALHTEAEASDTLKVYRLTIGKMALHGGVQLHDYVYHVGFLQGAVCLHLFHYVRKGNLSLRYRLGIVLAEIRTALYVVLQQFYLYCHIFIRILRLRCHLFLTSLL